MVLSGEAVFSKAVLFNTGALPFMSAKQDRVVCWQVALDLEEYMVIVNMQMLKNKQ